MIFSVKSCLYMAPRNADRVSCGAGSTVEPPAATAVERANFSGQVITTLCQDGAILVGGRGGGDTRQMMICRSICLF